MMTDENDIVIEPDEDDAPTASKETSSVIDTEPVFEEPTMIDETAVSPPPPTEPNPVSQRRGCVLLILGAILGAIMGTVLTLSILLGLNGSLSFTSTDAQLRRAINDNRIEQEDLSNELATRSAQLEAMATQIGGVAADQASVTEAMSTSDAEMEAVVGAVTAVATQVSNLDERVETTEGQIENAAAAVVKFDTFLNGLRELLFQGDTITTTPSAKEESTGQTATATPSETSSKTTPDATTTGEATRTVRPTRTPRPTSTTLPLATETSEP